MRSMSLTLAAMVSAAATWSSAAAAPALGAGDLAPAVVDLESAGGTRAVADEAAFFLGVEAVDLVTLAPAVSPGGSVSVTLPVAGLDRTLDLHPHSIRHHDYELLVQGEDGLLVAADPGPSRVVRGMIAGEPGTAVVGSMLDDGLYVTIRFADGTRWWVEPVAGRVAGALPGQHAIYANADIIPTGHSCGFAGEVAQLAAAPRDANPVAGATALGGGAPVLCVTELANDADVEYFNDYGSVAAVQDRIELVIATTNLQYETEVGITHLVTTNIVRTAEPDPYGENGSFELLCQFINEWTNNQSGIQRDVAQLFTGRDVTGGTIGRAAAIGSICEADGCSSFPCDCGPFGTAGSYCFSQSDFNNNFASATDLTAHELGHLWAAFHCSCPTFTMNPSITSSNTFEPTVTRPSIIDYRDTRPCLDCLEAVAFSFPDGLPTVVDPAGGTTVRVEVAEGLAMPQPGTGVFHLDTGSGFVSTPMTELSTNVYEAVFPAIDCPTAVAYFFSVEVPGIGTVSSPGGAPAAAYTTFAAASVAVAFEDDFEADLGWSVVNGPGLTDGAWTRGVPVGGGDRGDPPADGDGSSRCWLTDNVDGNSDVDGGATTLVSPVLDASFGNAIVSYLRWYDNTAGDNPSADVFTVQGSDDGGATWTTLEIVGPGGPEAAGGWFPVSIPLADAGLASNDQFRIRFIAEDAGDGSVVEAGVDGVRLVAADCATVPPCPADLDGSGVVGFDDLLTVLSSFGPCVGCPEDLDGNGSVGFEDVLEILAAFGPCPE